CMQKQDRDRRRCQTVYAHQNYSFVQYLQPKVLAIRKFSERSTEYWMAHCVFRDAVQALNMDYRFRAKCVREKFLKQLRPSNFVLMVCLQMLPDPGWKYKIPNRLLCVPSLRHQENNGTHLLAGDTDRIYAVYGSAKADLQSLFLRQFSTYHLPLPGCE